MTIASTRAQAVATILWELKRAEKLSTLSAIADRAGFSPGPSCRTISTCLKTVRRDWPHLEWWRAVADNGQLEQEQAAFLQQNGFATSTESDGTATVASFAEELMSWEAPEEAAPAVVEA
jgi:alkylated DNA nucleotide flippase Atl1